MRRELIALAPLALLLGAPAAHAQADNPTIKEMLADPQYVALDAQAKAGDPAAMVKLAEFIHTRLTRFGLIGFGDMALKGRMQWLARAMGLGYAPAMKAIGDIALIGDGLPKNLEVAREFYRMAAEKGDIASLKLAAELHLSDESPLYSHRHAQRAMEGELSMQELIEELDRPFDPSEYTKNGDEAVALLSLPAARSDREAQRMLAAIYLIKGDRLKDGAQPLKALKIYEDLAKREDAAAYASIGDIYAVGYPQIPADPHKAALYYGQAARLGDGRAAWSLGVMHAIGQGIPQDPALAFVNFQRSANAGYAKGMTSLGFCYQDAIGTAKDEALAAQWLEKGGEAGDPEGAWSAGELWNRGVDGTRNPLKAWLSYKRAAELGDEKAKTKLETFKP